jgi:3-hydroxyanthranilate 3,4-dioxygenase
MFYTFKEAATAGPYDEAPMLPPGVDPQLHLSRNTHLQPFWLILEKDSLIVQMSGAARVEMRDGPVLWEDLVPGDYLYVPAGTPHRIDPQAPSVMYRYKAERAGLEAVAWYCEECRSLLYRRVWDTALEVAQSGYLHSCEIFNTHPEHRTCEGCGTVHPEVKLEGYRWAQIAGELAPTT